ncbi:hypothetical protein [Microbacterium phyllosphaerae]|uniref:hypothetical protein n=1 Tax=Microbacterium phyllosphaerae TaxID=124798 RepID=UPI002168EA4D|nr:hypothetical protein [Microbacterium phyllosphaerae]MCS3441226.1 hypothetical protein [Microbacterium phyllosphaerae]
MLNSSSTTPSTAGRRAATKGVVVAGIAVALGLLLAGCTDSAPDPKPTPTATEPAEAGITDIQDTPGSGEGLEGALADAEVKTCELAGDHWEVAGSVTNSSDADASYRIYVSLLTEGGDTRSLTQVDVDPIAAGAIADWETTVAVEDEALDCVLRVERYAS